MLYICEQMLFETPCPTRNCKHSKPHSDYNCDVGDCREEDMCGENGIAVKCVIYEGKEISNNPNVLFKRKGERV